MLLICVIGLLLLCAGPAEAQSVLKLSRIAGIPDQTVGSRILEVVYQRLQMQVEFIDMPATRALEMSSSGMVDGECQRIIEVAQQYETLLPVRPAINAIEPAVFSKHFDFQPSGWSSIADYRVGIVRGVGSSERGTSGMQNVEAATSLDTLFKMLDNDRLDLIVTDLFGGRLIVRQMKIEAVVHDLQPPLQKVEIFHYLNIRHKNLVPRVEAVLRSMAESGELAHLREQIEQQMIAGSPR